MLDSAFLSEIEGVYLMQRPQAGGNGLFGCVGLCLVLVTGLLVSSAGAQETPSAAPPDSKTVFPSATQDQEPAEKTQDPSAKKDSDSEPGAAPLRLGVGDLLEIGVYNVP